MADFHYMPLFTDAYLADTRHLTTEEHGAYLLLLMEAWRRERCCLPDNDNLLARLTGLELNRWMSIKPAVMAFWTLNKRRKEWTQKRLNKERTFVAEKSEKNRGAAVSRWNKEKKRNANAMPKRCQNDAPITTPIPKDSSKDESPPIKYPPDFEAWFREYPKSDGKAAALAAYRKAVAGKKTRIDGEVAERDPASPDELMAAVKLYAVHQKRRDPKKEYTPHASTWLNQIRYLDDFTENPNDGLTKAARRRAILFGNGEDAGGNALRVVSSRG